VIYLDSSVALAYLLEEDRAPAPSLWGESLVSSRLLQYEVWNRLHAGGFTRTHGEEARALMAGLALVELTPTVLARALEPFPTRLRTLDALHLASIEFLREQGQAIELATYDDRLAAGAEALGIKLAPL
jgi:predicted nucleic acid-binding protein